MDDYLKTLVEEIHGNRREFILHEDFKISLKIIMENIVFHLSLFPNIELGIVELCGNTELSDHIIKNYNIYKRFIKKKICKKDIRINKNTGNPDIFFTDIIPVIDSLLLISDEERKIDILYVADNILAEIIDCLDFDKLQNKNILSKCNITKTKDNDIQLVLDKVFYSKQYNLNKLIYFVIKESFNNTFDDYIYDIINSYISYEDISMLVLNKKTYNIKYNTAKPLKHNIFFPKKLLCF